MNANQTSAEELHTLAIALLRVQQTRQWLRDVETSREKRRQISRTNGVRYRFGIAGIAIAILVLLLCASRCFGQSTFGSIRGTVQDASGAVIPGAQVALHNLDENTDRTVTSDDSGNYVLENVQAGKYRLRASHNGLADTELDGITLAARQDLRLPLTMKVAA
ncbi:MAG TPA: carboxypeptidase-like regulatory domain-containing protein, partial [Terracidiphilus sp.]